MVLRPLLSHPRLLAESQVQAHLLACLVQLAHPVVACLEVHMMKSPKHTCSLNQVPPHKGLLSRPDTAKNAANYHWGEIYEIPFLGFGELSSAIIAGNITASYSWGNLVM